MEKPFYRSHKFQYAVGGIAIIFVAHFLGMSVTEIFAVAGVAVTLIGGQAAADWGKHAKQIETVAREKESLLGALMTQHLQGSTLEEFNSEAAKKLRDTINEIMGNQ